MSGPAPEMAAKWWPNSTHLLVDEILAVVETMGGRRPGVVENGDLGGEKGCNSDRRWPICTARRIAAAWRATTANRWGRVRKVRSAVGIDPDTVIPVVDGRLNFVAAWAVQYNIQKRGKRDANLNGSDQ